MTRLARSRIEQREKTRKTFALLRYCANRKRIPRYRRVLTRIEKDRKRQMKGYRK